MKQTYGDEEVAILRVVLEKLRSEPQETALEVLVEFVKTVANTSYLEALAEGEAPTESAAPEVESEAPTVGPGGTMYRAQDDFMSDLKENMVKSFVEPVVARTKATAPRQTLAQMVAPVLDGTGDKSLDTVPLSGLAREILADAAPDALARRDGEARAVKSAALAAPVADAGMLPGGLQSWLRGDDQPAPDGEVQQADAVELARLGEHMARVLRGGAPATVAQGDGMDPRNRAAWIARQRELSAADAERFGSKKPA